MECVETKYKLVMGETNTFFSNDKYCYKYTRLEGQTHGYTQLVSKQFHESSAEARLFSYSENRIHKFLLV